MRRASSFVVTLVAFVATSCGTGPQDAATRVEPGASPGVPGDDSFTAQHEAVDHVHTWATLIAPALLEAADRDAEIHAKAVEVLATVELLLRERGALLADATRASRTHDERASQAVRHRIEGNSSHVVRTVADVLGRDASDELEGHWRTRTHALLNLGEAILAEDHDAERRAHEEAQGAAEEVADWAEDATLGAVPAEDLEHELLREERHLSELFESIADDTEERHELLLATLRHTSAIAELLVAGLAADRRLQGDIRTQGAATYVALAGAMEDHVLLLSSATRVVLETEQRPAGAALSDATTALVDVVADALDQQAASELHALWAEHTNLLLGYAEATAAGEESTRNDLRAQLTEWSRSVGELLERATGGSLHAASMEREAAGHVDTVITTIEAQSATLGP